MPDIFDTLSDKNSSKDIFDRLASQKSSKKQEPLSIKRSAGAYSSGVAGGAGGIGVDIARMIGGTGPAKDVLLKPLKGTKQLTEQFTKQLGAEPENALERILIHAGEFGGQEATIGTAIGGPVGGGTGLAHGTASGLVFGGLKEIGLSDEWALGITALATLSPVAATRLWPKMKESFKKGASFEKAAQKAGATREELIQVGKIEDELAPAKYFANPTKAIEKDFREVTNNLIKEHKTVKAVREDPIFKEKMSGLFDKVEEFAAKNPKQIYTPDIKREMLRDYTKRKKTGISKDEYEMAYKREFTRLYNSIEEKDASLLDMVKQYRKNNASAKKFYEPGKSRAYNDAKRDILNSYNEALEQVMTKQSNNQEFNDLFKFTNLRWQEIHDIEAIEGFLNNMFKSKIDYTKAKLLLRKDMKNLARPFRRIMGEEGFKNFQELVENFVGTEKGMQLANKAKAQGYDALAKDAGKFLIKPSLSASSLVLNLIRKLYKMVLERPKDIEVWLNAVKHFKEGKFGLAEKELKQLESSLVESPKEINLQ